MKNASLVKIEGPLDTEAARILRAVDGIEVDVQRGRDRPHAVAIRFGGSARPLAVEVKKVLTTAVAWQVVQQTEAGRKGDQVLLVATREATADARDILRRHGIGLVDAAGNAHVELPGLLLHIEGRRRAVEKPIRRTPRLSGKAGVVAQALFLGRDRTWQIHELAQRAEVSAGLVHRVLTRLEGEGIVASEGAGPRRTRQVVNAAALLDLWAEENVDLAVERTMAFRLARTPEELVAVVGESLGKAHVRYALTRSAAAFTVASFVTAVPTVDMWIESALAPQSLLKALGADRVDGGANLLLMQTPGDAPMAFRSEQSGVWIVNVARLYYDLRREPRRGLEQADRLRQEVIGL
ncbi:MAG: hypothetical protein ACP5PW_02710 [Candidatus Dormibacteria bacterium]